MSTTTKRKPNMRAEALRLAEHGFRVFPLNGKIPIGGRGCLDATNDELQIESWWEQHPHANIGLATGKGIAVLDIDVRRDGANSLDRLKANRVWPKTVTTKSGGGGRHYFFGVTHDMWVPNSKDRLGKGVELLYDGRYVVAPPSLHPISHKRYEWLRDPAVAPCAQLPQWLLELNIQESGKGTWQQDKFKEEIVEGEGRNNFLTSYAGALRRNGATGGEILDALKARNERVCRPALPERDLKLIASSVSRYDPADPMVAAEFTDVGNSERFATVARGKCIYVPGIGWHLWSGACWVPDDVGVQEVAKRVTREILNAAQDMVKDNDEVAKKLKSWGIRSSSMGMMESMVKVSRTHPEMMRRAGDLDRGSRTINLANGTFDLAAGKLLKHNPGDLFTRVAKVEYDEEATCPRWNQFLEEILPEQEVRDYIQRAIGYSLCGDTSEQCFFMMYGVGSNGKSTFIETIRSMLGNYAIKTNTATIMGKYKGANGPTPDLVRLHGPRFVVAAESSDGSSLNESIIKDLTGEDAITARALFKSPIEFIPQLKLWVYTNHKPTDRGMDHGMWRRVRLIPFTSIIKKPNKRLRIQLSTELPGIFNWAYRGYLEWERWGLHEPDTIINEVRDYRQTMDSVGQFISEMCSVGEGKYVSAVELWNAFSKWQQELPYDERMRRNTFYGRLRELGFPHTKKRVSIRGRRLEQPVSAYGGLSLVEDLDY